MMKNPKIHIYIAIAAIILIIVGSLFLSKGLSQKPQLASMAVVKSNVTQGVNVDGTVQAAQDLNLAFEQGGTISRINVKAGDKVKKGQALVVLDSTSLSAALNQASAAVQGSQASYQKLINGATSQDVAVAQVALTNAQTALANTTKQQQVLVDNAYKALQNSGVAAIPGSGNTPGSTATISGTYTGKNQGQYQVAVYSTGSGLKFQYTGLENGNGNVDVTPQPLGTNGLYIQFSSTNIPVNNTWTISIPNTQSAAYVANNNAYQAALQTQTAAVAAAQSAVDSAQAALNLKQTTARPEDLAAAAAQLNAAKAQYQMVQSNYSNSVLIAPIDGIITDVKTKVGQTVAGSTLAPGLPVVSMISDQKFQVETFVAENDIGKIKIGDTAQVTLDAYGTNNIFPSTVVSIDPAATVIQGISTYKVTLQFNSEDARIRSGMGANVTITDETHNNVLAIPKSALLSDNGKTYVLVDNSQGNFTKTSITVGVVGIEGKAEVLSGLTEGQKVVYFGN